MHVAPTPSNILIACRVSVEGGPDTARGNSFSGLATASDRGASWRRHRPIKVKLFSATHSPLILASLEPHFDRQRDKLFWFDLQNDTVTFRGYPWAIHGDVVGWLTSEIFGLRQARSREAEVAIEAAEAFMRGDTKVLPHGLGTKAAIHEALTKYLAGLDPFWPRWIVEAKP